MESWFTCLLLVLQWKRIYNCLLSKFQGLISLKKHDVVTASILHAFESILEQPHTR